jgi:predicted nucleic acid-binding protein
VRAAIDANVFFDFYDEAPQGVESRALVAGWVAEAVDLHVTRELSNEIDRSEDSDGRKRNRSALTHFSKCEELASGGFDLALGALNRVLPPPRTENDSSDRRHLAWAIASGVEYFLTRDGALLAAAEQLSTEFKIVVVRPAEFVRRLDEFEREEEYAPARLAGGSLRWRLVTGDDEEQLATALHSGTGGETRAEFLRTVRGIACEPRRFELRGVFDDNRALALVAFEETAEALRVPLFRMGRGTALVTLARHLLHEAQRRAVRACLDVVELNEASPSHELQTALSTEDWRLGADGSWRKWTPRFVGTMSELAQRLRSSSAFATENSRTFVGEIDGLLTSPETAETASKLERLLWPAKVLGAGLKTFLIPIKPGWAEHLVDDRLASQRLFGVRDDLALNREAVYYRSPNRPAPSAPARLLWYVTDDDSGQGTMAVRACSALDEVVVGDGKEVFRRFKRFGVYGWRDVRPLMERSERKEIMALRFSSSERLAEPVDFERLRAIVTEHMPGKKGLMVAGPMEVNDLVFAKVYREGGLGNA